MSLNESFDLSERVMRLQKLYFPLKDYMDGSHSRSPTFKTTGWLPRLIQPFLLRLSVDLVVKSKSPPLSGSSLEAVGLHP